MDPLVIALVALSGVLHVAWNVRIKTAGDPLLAAAIGLVAGALIIVPLGAAVWWLAGAGELPADGLALGLGSGVIEAIYFVLLAAAYRRGDLSVVYPIARGTAPLILVIVGVGLLGERLATVGWIGVACLIAGFLALQRPWVALHSALTGRRRPGGPGPIAFALATGVAIAAYTTVDRVGTRLIDPVPYAAILWVSGSLVLAGVVVATRRQTGFRDPAVVRPAAIGGILTLAAYLLVLYALSVAPLTAVAPLRESATVLAAAWGALRLGEAISREDATRRIAASAVIVAGAILLALDA
ncbi:MAG TPA: DMT family transporter [Candidatus Limnocylindrales bacterium]|nr:DMT family transporter [Candidatus Limnocylindrales bacterium]